MGFLWIVASAIRQTAIAVTNNLALPLQQLIPNTY